MRLCESIYKLHLYLHLHIFTGTNTRVEYAPQQEMMPYKDLSGEGQWTLEGQLWPAEVNCFFKGHRARALSKPEKCQPACYIDHLCRHGTGQREGCIAV